ncbi:MAG: UDP-N-acetylglucosamine 2-epimerase (non-hydrolyzing) [Marinilabiliales bacterium]|nr:MAG: UDP-N-acetylglucosamine 2-epimerase (non-hydrolyzing) [Marinilabiliales bacterium]
MRKIISVVGARPNFIKIAPVHKAFQKSGAGVQHMICHTGQHFDEKMSKVFFDELEMPRPDFYLGVGGGSHASQTARIMMAFEEVLEAEGPGLVIVPGDVNSTLACSLVAVKMGIKVAHVEAGLRSFDRSMPEEVNRVLTDVVSDFLFVTEKSGMENLSAEGIDQAKVFFTGNVMIDSLVFYMPKIDASGAVGEFGLVAGDYVLVTFHRPSNVDEEGSLKRLLEMLAGIAEQGGKKVLFPVHPRTRGNISRFGLGGLVPESVVMVDPLGYIDFLALVKNAALVVTDSGGIQEETTFLGVPCITVRNNTERPVTVEVGTNFLVGTDFSRVASTALEVLDGAAKKGSVPELWDGRAAERIVEILMREMG